MTQDKDALDEALAAEGPPRDYGIETRAIHAGARPDGDVPAVDGPGD